MTTTQPKTTLQNRWNAAEAPQDDGLASLTYRSNLLGADRTLVNIYGGNTSTKNDVVVDGAPNMASEKSAYTPAMDAVQEVNIQQNAVDSEFGHSAGGVITVQMKSGTNAYHGTAYYLGRNPAINAVADHITRRANLTRCSWRSSTNCAPPASRRG